jgi:hypothetical protein
VAASPHPASSGCTSGDRKCLPEGGWDWCATAGRVGTAGEVGHSVVMVYSPRCGCGDHGCIEVLANWTAMERDVDAPIRAGTKSIVLNLTKNRGKDA